MLLEALRPGSAEEGAEGWMWLSGGQPAIVVQETEWYSPRNQEKSLANKILGENKPENLKGVLDFRAWWGQSALVRCD